MIEDLKHALRIYRRTPGASLVAVAVIAIGIAFVTAFVSLYVDLVLRPHPGFEDSNRLVTISLTDGRITRGLAVDDVHRVATESATLESLGGTISGMTFSSSSGSDSTAHFAELVTREVFNGIGPRIAHGRGLAPEDHEPESERVVVISHRFWQQMLAGRPDVVGTTIELKPENYLLSMNTSDAQPAEPLEFRIVGIAAPEFTGIRSLQNRELALWLPFESLAASLVRGPEQQIATLIDSVRRSFTLQTVGKLKRGANVAAAASELNNRFLPDLPNVAQLPGLRFDVIDGLVPNIKVRRDTQRQLQLFLGASVLLAIVAAANVSLFLLARAPGRRRELAIRLSVGAPLRRLVRQLGTEAALLVVTGAAVGLVLSVWLSGFLRGLTFLRQAEWRNVTLLDWRVLAITGTFLALLTLLVSLAPIVGMKRFGIAASSRQISARATVAQRIAGTTQIAIAGVLGAAALAFAWYLGLMLLAYPGYETRNLHAVRFSTIFSGNTISGEGLLRKQIAAREAIAALPGVTAVAMGGSVPGVQYNTNTRTIPDPRSPGEQIRIQLIVIDEAYVDVLGLRLLRGSGQLGDDANAVLVNRSLAQTLFGRDDVVGEYLIMSTQGARSEIVGVLDDLSFEHPLANVEPTAFLLSSSRTGGVLGGVFVVESALPSSALQAAIKRLGDTGALEVNIAGTTPLAEARKTVLAPDRARSFLTIGTAALVVLLAAFGFYGTQRYLVAAGRREYAIRASLGAGPRALGGLVFRRGFMLGLPGLVLGLPFAFIVVAWLRDDYISRDVSPALVTLGVALAIAALLLVASIGPARRARATQPAPLLRGE